jgi:hypothetical protein
MLEELARTPPHAPPPKRSYANVVIAAPNQEWAQDIADRLHNALPTGVRVDLGVPGEPLRAGRPLTTFTVRCAVSLPGVPGSTVTREVLSALTDLEGVETDYSQLLDLIVLTPEVEPSEPDLLCGQPAPGVTR